MIRYLKYVKDKAIIGSLFLFGAGLAYGQTPVKVTLLNSSEQFYSVQSTGKLWFDDSNLILNIDEVTVEATIPLSDIRKITFEERNTSGVSTVVKDTETIRIFPNPASDYFDLVSSDSEKLNVRIFNTNGLQVESGVYESGKRVDVSHLNTGIYVVVVNNQSFKFIKL